MQEIKEERAEEGMVYYRTKDEELGRFGEVKPLTLPKMPIKEVLYNSNQILKCATKGLKKAKEIYLQQSTKK